MAVKNTPNEITAKARYVRQSPRKLRLVADMVRGLSPQRATEVLKVTGKRAAAAVRLVILQGIANAKNNFQVSPDSLEIKSLQIENGPMGPKRMDKAHGARFNRGIRRGKSAHITLKLGIKERSSHGAKS